jgi:hypothetical protein
MTWNNPLFLERWFFSDIGHANKIKILTYLLTDEQVCTMLSHPNEEILQPNSKELCMKELNVVLRIKNTTGEIAWGTLSWRMPDRYWSKVDVKEMGVGGSKKYFCDQRIH